MARVKITDNSRRFAALLRAGIAEGTLKAARELKKLSRAKVNRKRARRRKGQLIVHDKTASRPGEPPKRITGTGFRSIDARRRNDIEKGAAQTYSNKQKAPYMAMYEFGPTRIRRPWMRPALMENRSKLFHLMVNPPKRKIRR